MQLKDGSRVKVKGTGGRIVFGRVNKDHGRVVNVTVYDKADGGRRPHTFTADIPRGSIVSVVRY
jgi:hypothetical protein